MSELDPAKQYKNTGNLTKRGDFNARYGTFSWFGWLADQIDPPIGRVLDIGCGPGWFWKSVAGRWQPRHLTLADISNAMLEAARARLAADYALNTVVADVAALPFADDSFDDVVAMHMLYHAADPRAALAEITRVLRPGGRAIITTVADDDLACIAALSRAVFGSSGTDLLLPVFGGARAAELLPEVFATVTHIRCKDTFAIDDTDAALDYVTSFPPGITADAAARARFHAAFEAQRVEGCGVVRTDRLQELFIVR